MQTEGLSSFVSCLVRMIMEMRMRKVGGRSVDPTQQGNCKFSRWFRWVIFLAPVLEETVRGKQGALSDGLGLCGTVERSWGVATHL